MASMTSTFVSTPPMATRTAAPRPARRSATVCAAARPEVRLLPWAVGTPQRWWTALLMLHVSASIYRSLQRRGRIRTRLCRDSYAQQQPPACLRRHTAAV